MSVPSAPRVDGWPTCQQTSIKFWWRAPATGTPLTNYTLACSAISYSQSLAANLTNYTVTGLTAGTEYEFTLTATNATGTGPALAFPKVSAGVPPFGPLEATVSTVNVSTALVSWTPSTITNQAPVYAYLITAQPSTAGASTLYACEYGYCTSSLITPISTNTYYRFLVQSVGSPGYASPFAYTSTLGFGGIVASNLIINFTASSYSGSGAWTNTGSLGSGYNATVEAGSPSKNGAGNGVVLNGSTNFTLPDLSLGNAWSVCLWVKHTSLPFSSAASWLTQLGNGGPINLMIYGNFPVVGGNASSTQISGGFYNGSTFTNPTALTITPNIWYQLTWSWNGSTLAFYVAGSLNSSVSSGNTASSSGLTYRIGRSYDAGSSSYMTGEVGQILVYNRGLTAEEAAQNYAATSSIFSV